MGSKGIDNLLCLGWVWFAIGTIWRIAEVALYGEVQPCDADTLATLLYLAAVALSYRRGVKHGKENNHD